MSLQDDIFDVAAVAREAGEGAAMDRIKRHIGAIERELYELREQMAALRAGAQAFKALLGK